MSLEFGMTRTAVRSRHSLLTPESFVRIPLPGWKNAEFVYLITPDMGAKFSMALVEGVGLGAANLSTSKIARFLFVLDGEISVEGGGVERRLNPEDFAFLAPSERTTLRYGEGSRFAMYEWHFSKGADRSPDHVFGSAADCVAVPLNGDAWLQVQNLLPVDPAFDAEFNLMVFEPGASLPLVETHFMEHGLLFLDGGGVYRLEESWYPVKKGDAIWMAPHVEQWFGALGKGRSRYLIYKNFNRAPLSETGCR